MENNQAPYELRSRYLREGGKRNMTVIHRSSNIHITSPDYLVNEKSDDQLKNEVWQVMKLAIKIWNK